MMYKLYKASILITEQNSGVLTSEPDAAMTIDAQPAKSFLFAPQNPDYQTFKKEVLAGAELQDADGNVITDASAYIASLP
jgi:hypothetical protein